MRLAAEVDALAAQLEASRARISELEARVDIDPLTDVLNRRGFERELKRSLAYVKRYGSSVALLFIDLDDFKPVNDRHGHAAGDAVLKAVAAALTKNVRASDVVARLGGDEFAVLLWNVNAPDAAAKARSLEAAIYATPVPLRRGNRRGRRFGGARTPRRARHAGRSAGARRRRDVCAQGGAEYLPPRAGRRSLRNNVRRQLVLDEGDAVAQDELALLQALHLNEVGARQFLQGSNRGIEVAMLLLQARQLRPKLAFFLFCHQRLGRPFGAVFGPNRPRWEPSQ